jgi:hypothetical protein
MIASLLPRRAHWHKSERPRATSTPRALRNDPGPAGWCCGCWCDLTWPLRTLRIPQDPPPGPCHCDWQRPAGPAWCGLRLRPRPTGRHRQGQSPAPALAVAPVQLELPGANCRCSSWAWQPRCADSNVPPSMHARPLAAARCRRPRDRHRARDSEALGTFRVTS